MTPKPTASEEPGSAKSASTWTYTTLRLVPESVCVISVAIVAALSWVVIPLVALAIWSLLRSG